VRNGVLRCERDHLFLAQRAAAVGGTGRTANGLIEWKDAQGRTLGDLRDAGMPADVS
jgi:hypothetical protein